MRVRLALCREPYTKGLRPLMRYIGCCVNMLMHVNMPKDMRNCEDGIGC